MEVAPVIELSVQVSPGEVLRNLGYPRGHRLRPDVARRLEQLWQQGPRLIHPRGTFRVISGEQAQQLAMPRPTERVGLGLCTVGPALEREELRLSEQQQMLDALLLDAYGSAAAEAAADALNLQLCVHAQELGLQLLPRFSPGYGSWDVAHQRQLLAMLPADRLGLSLTEGMMMIPRKSVSFAVRLTREAVARRTDRRHCARCELEGCAFRADPEPLKSALTGRGANEARKS